MREWRETDKVEIFSSSSLVYDSMQSTTQRKLNKHGSIFGTILKRYILLEHLDRRILVELFKYKYMDL